jgi:two-component system chemotaxis response regulator CheY
MRILVVDDSSSMRKIQRSILEQIGYTDVIEAENGYDAILKMKEVNFEVDLILLDWNMPKMDGLTTLKKLRSVDRFRKLPIIMVTSEVERASVIEAIKAGVTSYVIKPFTPEILSEKIRQVMGTS